MMRATLHLVSAADYVALRNTLQPVLQAAMAAVRGRDEGLDVERVVPVARKLLDERPRTFGELRAAAGRGVPRRQRARARLRRTDAPAAA